MRVITVRGQFCFGCAVGIGRREGRFLFAAKFNYSLTDNAIVQGAENFGSIAALMLVMKEKAESL